MKQNISLREKILELLMLDIRYFGRDSKDNYIPQQTLDIKVKIFLKEYPVGGITLFRENIDSDKQVKILTKEIQQNTNIPRFIAIDEEGGVVSRIGIETIGNMALGALNDISETKKTASLIAYKLSSLGINFNFAPVVDINSNPDNPIIGVRAFGSNPKLVTSHANAFIHGLHEFNIISTIKHFPGHGDTSTDSHIGTTTVDKSLDELLCTDLLPYTTLIKENILDVIMTAHIVVPELDANVICYNNKNSPIPATLSTEILTNLLRKKMQFDGIVITDAMDMKAITNNFDVVFASIESFRAGSDIILMPVRIWDDNGIKKFKEYFSKICEICNFDQELQKRINESYKRVVDLKTKFFLKNKNDINNFPINDFIKYQDSLAGKSFTLYKNAQNHLPFNLCDPINLLVIGNKENLLNDATHEIKHIFKQNLTKNKLNSIESICLNYAKINKEIISSKLKNISQIIILTYDLSQQDKEINTLFTILNKSAVPYVMISCRSPYDIKYATKAKTNILIYGVTGFDQTNYKINKFLLNLRSVLSKLFIYDFIDNFNVFCPIIV